MIWLGFTVLKFSLRLCVPASKNLVGLQKHTAAHSPPQHQQIHISHRNTANSRRKPAGFCRQFNIKIYRGIARTPEYDYLCHSTSNHRQEIRGNTATAGKLLQLLHFRGYRHSAAVNRDTKNIDCGLWGSSACAHRRIQKHKQGLI